MLPPPTTTSTTAIAAACLLGAGAPAQVPSLDGQRPRGAPATFHVAGPATGDRPDVQGDAVLAAVEYASGRTIVSLCRPVDVLDLHYVGDPARLWVRGGTEISVGIPGDFAIGESDGKLATLTPMDRLVFEGVVLGALQNDNLNNYVGLDDDESIFAFTIDFGSLVADDDPGPDDVGELLCFERGPGAGDSWLGLQAVDEAGAAMGPWLLVGPRDTLPTTPVVTVLRNGQTVGATSIDVSRLGVTQLRYLRVTNDVTAEPGYTGGGDVAPDFKIMAVTTGTGRLARR
jgi:hypothetical protein